MNFKMKWVVPVFLLFNVISLSARAETLKVGTYPFEPYFHMDGTGQSQGIWQKKLEETLVGLGYNPVFEMFPPPRLAKNMIAGRSDVTISARHIGVDGHVYYSEEPVDEIVLNVYAKKDKVVISNIMDMKGKSVILIRGYAYNGRINKLNAPEYNITVIEASNHEDAVLRLKNGNAEYLLDYMHPTQSAMVNTGVNPADFSVNEISRYPVYYLVSRRAPDALKLIKQLNDSLKSGKGKEN